MLEFSFPNKIFILQDGNVSALPFLCEAFGAWIAACVADKMRESGKLTITAIRRIFNTIGSMFFSPN